jgi:homospermidine synthase
MATHAAQVGPVHASFDGPIVMIGFGSIGRGTLPLIERHFKFDKSRMVVIDPSDTHKPILDSHGVRFVHDSVTRQNYKKLLKPLLTAGGGQGFCVNLSGSGACGAKLVGTNTALMPVVCYAIPLPASLLVAPHTHSVCQ